MRGIRKTILGLALACGAVSLPAAAAIPTYPNPNTINPVNYTFKAQSTGDIYAYFAGSGAALESVLGLLIDGVDSGVTGLNNHSSSLGQSLHFGTVTAGQVLTFFIKPADDSDSYKFYSDTTMNADGINHVWSTNFAGDDKVSGGTFVGFEDLTGGGDRDYNDLNFVFTNVEAISGAPEPATWAMMIIGFGGVGMALRSRRRPVVTACLARA